MQTAGLILLSIGVSFLLLIQYTMVVSDWRENRSKTWEKIVGIIPLGPYALMILTAFWYIIQRIIGNAKQS